MEWAILAIAYFAIGIGVFVWYIRGNDTIVKIHWQAEKCQKFLFNTCAIQNKRI